MYLPPLREIRFALEHVAGLGRLRDAGAGDALAPELLREFKDAQMVIYGVTLILCVQFLPDGLISLVERTWRAVWRTPRDAA